MMHFTRHPFTQTLHVSFGPPIRRDEFDILHDVCGRTVGRVDPPDIAKDLLPRFNQRSSPATVKMIMIGKDLPGEPFRGLSFSTRLMIVAVSEGFIF